MATAILGWRRAVAHSSVLLALCATFLLTTTLLLALNSYAASVIQSSLRGALGDAPLSARSLIVQVGIDGRETFDDRNKQVTSALDGAFATVGATVHSSATSVSYGFQPAAGDAVKDLATFAFYDGLRNHARLVQGSWPDVSVTGPVEAALPTAAARRLHLRPGDSAVLDNRSTGQHVTVTISGTFAVRAPESVFWIGDDLAVDGVQPGSLFTTHGPLAVPRSTFLERFVEDATAQWRAAPHFNSVTTADFPVLQRTVPALGAATDSGTLGPDVLVESELDALIASVDRPLLVIRSTIMIPGFLLALLAVSTLLLSTRLLNEHRAAEVQQMRARGMSSVQLAATTVREALVLIVPGALLAPWLAQLLLRVVSEIGPLADDGLAGGVAFGPASWLVSGAMVAAACAALMVGVFSTSTGAVAERRFRARASGLQRAGGDVVLASLAVLAYWQLQRYRSPVVSDTSGQLTVDPLLVLAPVALLLAGAVLFLRLVPLLARAAEGVARRARGVVAALGIWQLSRRARAHIRPTIVLALAMGIAVFLLVFADSWTRSSQDQADFQTGGDIRLTSVPAGVTAQALGGLPSVDAVSPVSRDRASFGGVDAELVGLDAATAGEVLVLRPDLSDRPLVELTNELVEARSAGLTLAVPPAAEALTIPLRMAAEQPPRVTADVFAVVRDRVGLLHRVPLGSVPADDRRRELVVGLGPFAGPVGVVAVEIRPADVGDVSLDVRLWTPRAKDVNGDDLGPVAIPAGSQWRLSFERSARTPPRGELVGSGGEGDGKDGDVRARLNVGCCDTVTFALLLADSAGGQDGAIVPALIGDELARALGGADAFALDVRGAALRLRVRAVVDGVPSVDPSKAAGVVVDLATLSDVLYRQTRQTLTVDEWLLSTGPGDQGDAVEAIRSNDGLAGATVLPASGAGVGASAPLSAGVVGALSISTLAAGLLASVGFAFGSLVSVRGRRSELSILHAVGVGRRLATRLLILEQAVVVALGVGVGLLVGTVVARLVVPLVTMTPAATVPFPPVLVTLPWARIGAFTATVVVITALIIGGLLGREGAGGSRPAERLREYG